MFWPLVFLFGLSVGSFLSCLVYRLNSFTSEESPWATIRGVIFGRSFCPQCRRQLSWFDNIPLLSFILLKGRCRYCHSPIGIHYPLMELAAGLLTVLVISYQLSVISLIIAYLLLAVLVSDWLYQTIPDQIVYPAVGLAIIYLIINYQLLIINYLLCGLGAALFFWLLVWLTKGKGMGMGDVKFASLMGLILGWPKILLALYLAFITGAVVGVILVAMGKKKFRSHVAFGPFLVVATLVAFFLKFP